jgi:hypothetical protein
MPTTTNEETTDDAIAKFTGPDTMSAGEGTALDA